jgi:hypothetical protein
MMKGSVFILLGLVSLLWAAPCEFPAFSSQNFSIGSIAEVLACFRSIPLSPGIKEKTILQLRRVVDFYVQSALSLDSGPPYNVKVTFISFLCNY